MMLRKSIFLLTLFSLFLLILFFGFKWATGSIITDYSDCVSAKLIFEFKDNLNLYVIDDSSSTGKYSTMNFPEGEHYICIGENDECTRSMSEGYFKKWKIIPLHSAPFHLTGSYKTNIPNFLLGAFAPSTEALQAKIAGKLAWLPTYNLDKESLKKSSYENLKVLYNRTELINKNLQDFQCPNESVKEVGWELIW